MHRLLLLGLNHTTAPLPVRERLAFNADQRRDALARLRERFPGCEAVLLSTCNRVELYVSREVHGHPRADEMVRFLAELRSIPPAQFEAHLYHKAERDAVAHLFNVVGSLDSMVIGETQILAQVREAYDAAVEASTVRAALHPLFQRAVAVGKQVLTETPIAEGRVSVASVAVDYAGRIFDDLRDKTVLSIGAGKMAALVLRHFAELRPRHLLVCNRDATKAHALAAQHRGEPAAFERLDEHLVAADVVIASTGAPEPIITRARFERLLRQRRYRPVFLIDIALPRNVERAVGDVENVYLYDLDDLQQVVSASQSQRREALDAARAIVAQQVEQYERWTRARAMGPLIDRISRRSHELAREELDRTLRKIGPVGEAERAHLEELTRRIVNKLLHDPIKALRESDAASGGGPHGSSRAAYLHAVEKLFHLSAGDADDRSDAPTDTAPPSDPDTNESDSRA